MAEAETDFELEIKAGKSIFSLKTVPVTQLFEECSQVTCLHVQR